MATLDTPNALVSTTWLSEHLNHPQLRLIEIDVDYAAYTQAHVPGAIGWHWQRDLQHPSQYDLPTAADFAALLARSGITPDSTVVVYGDRDNWLAAYAFWLLRTYCHATVKMLDGGRKKWVTEGLALTDAQPVVAATPYPNPRYDGSQRIQRDALWAAFGQSQFIDTRQPRLFSGEWLADPLYPSENAQRGGHIPNAHAHFWQHTVEEDGSFKANATLQAQFPFARTTPLVVYGSIGAKAAHTWFVLKELLGYADVRLYDGGWVEYGNLIGAPIEKTYQDPATVAIHYSI